KSGFLYPPYNKEKFNEMVKWAKKWSNKDVEKLEKLNYDDLHKIQIAGEHSSVFGPLFFASVKVGHISTKNYTFDDFYDLKEVVNRLPPHDEKLFGRATGRMQTKLLMELFNMKEED
ncbi:hypothetical protein PFISCL1PPCAC_27714, partial [Pristionchus fissidentatus]